MLLLYNFVHSSSDQKDELRSTDVSYFALLMSAETAEATWQVKKKESFYFY